MAHAREIVQTDLAELASTMHDGIVGVKLKWNSRKVRIGRDSLLPSADRFDACGNHNDEALVVGLCVVFSAFCATP